MEDENRLVNISDILKNLTSPETRGFNKTLISGFQKRNEEVSLTLRNLGVQLKEFADNNFNTWREIYRHLKGMSQDDVYKILKHDAGVSATFTAFLDYLRKGLVPLQQDYTGPIKESYIFYDLNKQEFETEGREEGDGIYHEVIISEQNLGIYINRGLIDINCLNPQRFLENIV